VKVRARSYGLDGTDTITAASGRRMSIAEEALAAGLRVGLLNSGTITEPGTGAFVARVDDRYRHEAIALQVLRSGAQVILGGGERYFLPAGAPGRHARAGVRRDGLHLVDSARARGYTVVYTAQELDAVPPSVTRVLGLFADDHTFHDEPEETLRSRNLPHYLAGAPGAAQMTAAALRMLSAGGARFLLIAEEEGTDNFANVNNAAGTIEAVKRADDAVGVVRAFIRNNPETLLLIAADSDAGGLSVAGLRPDAADRPLPPTADNGSPQDGVEGTATRPFLAAPDRHGNRLPFAVCWSTTDDVAGSVLVRAEGYTADRLPTTVDNTDIYKLMYRALFGRRIP
jgi:alkaline phosphatase